VSYVAGPVRAFSVPASRIRSVLKVDSDTEVGTDTCPERGVILRVWVKNAPANGPDGLDSYELEPEDALELAGSLVETAHLVMVRRVMSS